jgi:putative endonuclease
MAVKKTCSSTVTLTEQDQLAPKEQKQLTPAEQGRAAESLAADYFLQHGYRVLERNYRTRRGEVDLILEKGCYLIFVEVRYRRSTAFGSPEETITPAKQRKVILAALEYVVRRGLGARMIRFDVVSLVQGSGAPRIEHIEDAFEAKLPGLSATLL